MANLVLHIVLNDFVHDSRVLKECKTLLREGYSVSVIALHRDGLSEQVIQNGLKIRRLRLSSRSLPSFLKQFYIVRFFGFVELFVRFILYFLRMKSVDVVHCHDLEALPLGVTLKILRKANTIVYDAHELETEKKSLSKKTVWQLFAHELERTLIVWVDACITVSKSIASDYAKRYGCKEPRLVLNFPPYVDTLPQSNRLRSRFQLSDTTRIFLYQGGLSNGRSIPVLLDIFESEALSRLDVALIFVGYGNLESEVKLRAKGPLNRIYFLPAVSPDDLLPITASADVGLSLTENTCLSHFYSLPNKLCEYIMAGLSVVASDFPEISKIVKKHSCGEVVNVEDPSEIGRVIQKMATIDITPYRRNARKAARDLCWERQEQVLLSTYREILENHKKL